MRLRAVLKNSDQSVAAARRRPFFVCRATPGIVRLKLSLAARRVATSFRRSMPPHEARSIALPVVQHTFDALDRFCEGAELFVYNETFARDALAGNLRW